MVEGDLTHDRWLIDKKLKDVERFENKQLQIIGIITIIVTLLSQKLPPSELISVLLWILVICCSIVLIGIYLYLAWPRKTKTSLKPSYKNIPTSKDYKEYIEEIQVSLSRKARAIFVSYILFGVIILGILGIVTIA